MDKRVDFSKFTGAKAKEEPVKQPTLHEHVRSQTEIEQHPAYHRRQLELEGWSEWSGSRFAGRGRW
jgi:hypothetical protein